MGSSSPTLRGTAWGTWQIPEAELGVLGDVAGKDVLELGCDAARFAIALAGLGARCVGLDNSARQLEHARTAGADFELVHAAARPRASCGLVADRLQRDHFDTTSIEEPQGAITFTLGYGDWVRLLRANGLVVEDLVERVARKQRR